MNLDALFRRIILPAAGESEPVPSLIRLAPTTPTQPIPVPLPPPNGSDRERLITALRSGAPVVLLHGRAGTGKTSLILSLRDEGLRHVVLAPTGIAALNAGGQTIHKFFGIPPRIVNLDDIKPRHRLGSILRKIDLIVIDEISMVRADLLDVVDRSLRVHLDPDKPHAIVVVAEGAKYNAEGLCKQFEKKNLLLGYEFRSTVLGYVQRGATPTCADRLLGTRLGSAAVEQITAGNMGVLVGTSGREVITTPLDQVVQGHKPLDPWFLSAADMLAR